ncbi:hypothetical protein BCR34DRAFT_583440 [Clohesyomyces aquaticus]|uniref:Extracellular membrane protein CFEM domain-containing protein n=1 Tax=Clohesyomyces aquaticus TaxID=1231657 RepID=A0A1Y2A5H1_9PLEO|nr:hypothetical protein BCR34DRAFT_583440 [Clohesyomyces aquaticus]
MRPLAVFPTSLVIFHHALAQEAHSSPSVTQTTCLPCATGDAFAQWDSCSSSVSVQQETCSVNINIDSDAIYCACSAANAGFSCLKSYYPTNTEAICLASVYLDSACHLAGLDLPAAASTDSSISCPATITNLWREYELGISSNVDVGSIIPFFGLSAYASGQTLSMPATPTTQTSTTSVRYNISAPKVTNAGTGVFGGLSPRKGTKGEEWDAVRVFLGFGILVAVLVAGMSAFL